MPRPVHFEIQADEPERAIEFYTHVLGWSFQKWDGGPMAYWMVITGEDGTPGINGGLLERMYDNGADKVGVNAYVCTVDVDDLDAYMGKVEQYQGRIVVPKMAVPGVGWMCYCKDPEGNLFGMMQMDETAH